MKKTIDLLAIGAAYVDVNCTRFPFDDRGLLPETETVGEQYEIVPGGSALNFARFCASLGLKTAFVGKTGQDKMGVLLTELLEQSGVQSELISDGEAATNLGLNFVNEAGQTIMGVAGNAKFRLTTEEIEHKLTSLLPQTGCFMLGGVFKLKTLLPVLEQILATAKASGTKIAVDHGRLVKASTPEARAFIKNLVLKSDYYFPSRDEFLQLWSVASIEEGLHLIAGQSSVVIAVKDSSNGALSLQDGEIIRVPAFSVQPINTIGAGDSFNAGFIVARKNGLDLTESLRFACATAALKISRTELPTYQAVTDFLQTMAHTSNV